MLGALRPIEGIWVRTKLVRGVPTPPPIRDGGVNSHYTYSKLSGALKKYRSEVLPSEDTFWGKYEDTFWGKN